MNDHIQDMSTKMSGARLSYGKYLAATSMHNGMDNRGMAADIPQIPTLFFKNTKNLFFLVTVFAFFLLGKNR